MAIALKENTTVFWNTQENPMEYIHPGLSSSFPQGVTLPGIELSISAAHNEWLTLHGSNETEMMLHALVREPELASSTLPQCLLLR